MPSMDGFKHIATPDEDRWVSLSDPIQLFRWVPNGTEWDERFISFELFAFRSPSGDNEVTKFELRVREGVADEHKTEQTDVKEFYNLDDAGEFLQKMVTDLRSIGFSGERKAKP